MLLRLWEAVLVPHTQERALLHQGRWSYTRPLKWRQCSCTFTRNGLYCTFREKEMAHSVFLFRFLSTKRLINSWNAAEAQQLPSKMLSLSTGRERVKLRPLGAVVIPTPNLFFAFVIKFWKCSDFTGNHVRCIYFLLPAQDVALSLRYLKLPAEGDFHFPSPSWAVHPFWPIRTENAWKTI